jgi:hypothetical protein
VVVFERESEEATKDLDLPVLPGFGRIEAAKLVVDFHAVQLAQHNPLANLGSWFQWLDGGLVTFFVRAVNAPENSHVVISREEKFVTTHTFTRVCHMHVNEANCRTEHQFIMHKKHERAFETSCFNLAAS